MARISPSQSFDDLYYLRPGFDPKSLTVPQLRNLLYKHDIDFPSSAKKTELQEFFKKNITPHSTEWLEDHEDAMSNPSSEGIKDAAPPAKIIYSETSALSDYEDVDVEEDNVDSQKTWSQVEDEDEDEESETDEDEDEGFYDKESRSNSSPSIDEDDDEEEETETDMDESETDVDEVATDVDEMETDVDIDMVDDIEAQLQREMEAHLVISTPPSKKKTAGGNNKIATLVSANISMTSPVTSPRSTRKVTPAKSAVGTPAAQKTASPKKTPTKKTTPTKKAESQTPAKKAVKETPVKAAATAKTPRKVVEPEKKPVAKKPAKKVVKDVESKPAVSTGGRSLRPRKVVSYAE